MADIIVAIELGSSKITGVAGRKNLDGSINVLSLVSEDSTSCIRKGVVYNIDKTGQALSNIINKLEQSLKSKIVQVYVGVGGQSIRSVLNSLTKTLPADSVVTQEMVDELMDANRSMDYPELKILDAVTQEYRVDQQYQLDPVGIQCAKLEGNYLNILCRRLLYRNLTKCFEQAGITIAEMYLSPLALADSVLSEAEKRSGCALVDLGADTTTVAVYFKSVLRNLTVIPLGGANITKDIASLQMDESEAEAMKLKYASACTDDDDVSSDAKYAIDGDRQVEVMTFNEIVSSRLEEIITNVWNNVPKEYVGKLIGGVILTGGGSKMKNIEKEFRQLTNVNKVRMAKTVMQTISTSNARVNAKDGTLCTVLGILAKGNMNCVGEEINNSLFGGQNTPQVQPGTGTTPSAHVTGQGNGVIKDDPAKAAEEEARRQKEQQEAEEIRRQQEQEAEEERRRRENSGTRKVWRGIKHFFNTMVSPEEDEK